MVTEQRRIGAWIAAVQQDPGTHEWRIVSVVREEPNSGDAMTTPVLWPTELKGNSRDHTFGTMQEAFNYIGRLIAQTQRRLGAPSPSDLLQWTWRRDKSEINPRKTSLIANVR